MATPTINTPRQGVLRRDGGRRKGGWIFDYDWILVGAALSMSLLGSMLVWSATRPRRIAAGLSGQTYLEKHLST